MRFLLPLLVILTFWTTQVSAQSLAETFYDSTAILYKQTSSGGMQMACTATAFERSSVDEYLFVSASHCVAEDNLNSQKVEVSKVPFYISFDRMDEKVFHSAEVVMAGYQSQGDDFAILRVESEEDWPVVQMGQYPEVRMGDEIINVAAPGGLGKQVFFGYVSMVDMDRPVLSRGINWMHATLLQIHAGPGSSGSCVVSKEQGAVVAFIVGAISGNPSVVAVPVSRFLEFRIMVESGQYKWFELEEPNKKDGILVLFPPDE